MSMNEKQKEFLKYVNGIKYLLFDRKSTVNAEDITVPNKIKELCEKYFIPTNKPIMNAADNNKLMVLQNNPDKPKYGYYVDLETFLVDILIKIDVRPQHLTAYEEEAFIQSVRDELVENNIMPDAPSPDALPMLNGYFDRTKSTFIEDRTPEIATGCAEVTYVDFSNGDNEKLEVYNAIKTLMEDNPSVAETLFQALSKEANQSHTIVGQFYTAVCDGQPYAPCKGCHANKKTDCALCSRNRIIRDMYKG